MLNTVKILKNQEKKYIITMRKCNKCEYKPKKYYVKLEKEGKICYNGT